MLKVGIIGLGMMGRTHYEAYQKLPDVRVTNIADINPARAAGDLAGTGGNVLAGGLQKLPMDQIKGTTDYKQLLASDVDIVDVCVPTPVHSEITIAALATGKHVLCEKPLSRTYADAKAIVDAAAKAKGFFMPAMCMRFWPGWDLLKSAAADGRYGKILSANFRRVSSMPGGWYPDGTKSGGAVLDLHIHDVDFVNYLFGAPKAVFSRGYAKTSGETDHIVTQYLYDNIPQVTAEGGWCYADGFGFTMRYTVNFERATLDFDIGRTPQLRLLTGGKDETVTLAPEAGYDGELRYFTQCVAAGKKPSTVTAEDGLEAIRIIEAEVKSVREGSIVRL